MPSIKGPIIGILIAGILTFAAYAAAVDAEKGVETKTSGRHALYKKALVGLATTLGPTGSLVVGGGITAGMVVWLVMTVRARRRYAESAGRHDMER